MSRFGKQRQGHVGTARPGSEVSRRAARAVEGGLVDAYARPLAVRSNGALGLDPASDPGPPPEGGDVAALRAWCAALYQNMKRGGFLG